MPSELVGDSRLNNGGRKIEIILSAYFQRMSMVFNKKIFLQGLLTPQGVTLSYCAVFVQRCYIGCLKRNILFFSNVRRPKGKHL